MLSIKWKTVALLLPACLGFTSAGILPLRADESPQLQTKAEANGLNQGSDALTELSPSQFAKFHAFLRPRPKEMLFGEIPWMFDLWAARKTAATEGKPLLILAASGNPCGTC